MNFMGFLFVTWIFLRNLLYAALQTNVIWTVAHSAVEPLEWMQVWWCLSVVHFVINFPRILRANDLKHLLPVDVGRFALSLWYGLISGSILTAILGAIIWLTRSWTSSEPDWFLLWLGTVSAAVLFWRGWAKRKRRKAWEGKPSESFTKNQRDERRPRFFPLWKRKRNRYRRR